MDEWHSFGKVLDRNGIVLCYRGQLSQAVTETLGDVVRERWKRGDDANLARSVFAVFIEIAQNITHYACGNEGRSSASPNSVDGTVLAGSDRSGAYIVGGNYIRAELHEDIERTLTAIWGMDKTQLKAYYKQQRRRDTATGGSKLEEVERVDFRLVEN